MNPTRRRALQELRQMVLDALGGHEAEIWLFGSCARGEVMQHSDIDVAILPRSDLPEDFFSKLSEAVEHDSVRCGSRRFAARGPHAAGGNTARRREMERLGRRLSEAAAALAKLDELAGKNERSLVERDSAVLRLIFTYEAVWKACQKLLAALENLSAASPNATIRAARNLGWLSDEDARAAIKLGEERNLAVHMYRDQVGEEIERHLAAHAALLHRWLDALRQRAAEGEEPTPSETYQLFERAMEERKQILCTYGGSRRELCPVILGHSQGEEKALTYQFGGESKSGLRRWKCLRLSEVSDAQVRDGPWDAGSRHSQKQTCVEIVDLDVNPDSPYNPKRLLSAASPVATGRTRRRPKREGAAAGPPSRRKARTRPTRRK
jgi:uncharacterized protein YutE (UPF0331/DUF86 family)